MARLPKSTVTISDDGKDPQTGAQVRPAWLVGEFVTIKTAAGGGARSAITSARYIITPDEQGNLTQYHPNPRASALLTYETYVVDGLLIDEESGEKLKATPQLLDTLDAGYQQFILSEITRHQAAWDNLGGGNDASKVKTFPPRDERTAAGEGQETHTA